MYSETLLAKDIFSPVWGLSFLGAIASVTKVDVPFDPQLLAYVQGKQEVLERLMVLIESATGLDSVIVLLGLTDAPWTRIDVSSHVYDLENVLSELWMTTGTKMWRQLDLSDKDE